MHTILPHTDNPTLKKSAHEIPLKDISSKKIQDLISEMKELLAQEEYGVALAAPQVGEPLRLFVVSSKAITKREARYGKKDDSAQDLPSSDEVYINPVLLKMSRGKKDKHEGCLSVRGKWGMVPRAEKTSVRAYNEKGEPFTRGASGLLAHIFQHELDHLDGILYIDKATELFDDSESTESN